MNPLSPDIQHRIATDRQLDLLREADEARLARIASTSRAATGRVATGRAASPGTSQPGEVGSDPAPTGWLSGLRLIGRRVPRGL